MKKILALFVICLIIGGSCAKVPLTGRRQIALIPNASMNSMSFSQYSTFMQQNRPITGTTDAEMVQRVGQRISSAVTTYLKSKGLEDKA